MSVRRLLLVILGIIVVAVVGGVLWIRNMTLQYEAKIRTIQINEVDLNQIADGVYTGSEDAGPIKVQVRVTVRDRQIKAIELLCHVTGRGQGAEVLPARVVEAQSPKVDFVAGATSSSKVILKAIENALTGK